MLPGFFLFALFFLPCFFCSFVAKKKSSKKTRVFKRKLHKLAQKGQKSTTTSGRTIIVGSTKNGGCGGGGGGSFFFL